jgi:hypothetical protein
MKDFNFGFGTEEPVPLKMGKFFAEFTTQTRIKDAPSKEEIEPLKLYPCKDSAYFNSLKVNNESVNEDR